MESATHRTQTDAVINNNFFRRHLKTFLFSTAYYGMRHRSFRRRRTRNAAVAITVTGISHPRQVSLLFLWSQEMRWCGGGDGSRSYDRPPMTLIMCLLPADMSNKYYLLTYLLTYLLPVDVH